ncbi:MAG TPA: NAD(P)H-binding protein [Anaeromyxobacteraceae bacterium]|nr:NAD(P)H-binding protein [Anaeromyxobacteraceae bacterium]
MNERTLAVAGATGNCGSAVVAAAKAHGLSVRALVRDPSRLGHTGELCDEVRIVHVTQPDSLRGALSGVELLVSALGKTRQKDRIARWAVDVGANLNLFGEAQRAGVGRVALVSVYGARPDHPISMVRMKSEAEQGLERSGLPFVVVQPTGFFSDLWEVFLMARRGAVWSVGSADLAFNPIALEDLGEFIVRALIDDASVGRRLPIGGPEVLSVREMAGAAGRVLGCEVKVRELPLWLARGAVGAVRPFSRNLWELGQFFVGYTTEIARQGGRLEAPVFGAHRLEDYFRSRWEREARGP